MKAAATIVSEHGAEALTMEGIAAEAGVNKALVYRFFANRDAALIALWKIETEAFDARLQAAISERETLEDKLLALFDTWLDQVEAGGGVLGRLDVPGVGPAELERLRDERREAVVYFIAEMFREEYDVPIREAVTAASVLGLGAQGLASLWAHTGWPRKKLAATFVRLCIGAIESISE